MKYEAKADVRGAKSFARRAQCFGLKESTCIYGTTYGNTAGRLQKSPFNSLPVGLAQARPNCFSGPSVSVLDFLPP